MLPLCLQGKNPSSHSPAGLRVSGREVGKSQFSGWGTPFRGRQSRASAARPVASAQGASYGRKCKCVERMAFIDSFAISN